jgi:hypothetical protein
MSVLQGSVYVAELVADSDLSSATVTCTVTAPDGTISTPTPTVAGLLASVPITATLPGGWGIVWATSGTVVGAVQDQFTCVPFEFDLISLPDLKEELQITADTTKYDPKLRRWLKSATNVVENVTGPIRLHDVQDVFDGGTVSIVLTARWIASITLIAENVAGTQYVLTEQPLGSSSSAYGFTWDKDTNTLIRRDQSGGARAFAAGRNNVVVNYKAGLPVIPDDVQLATAELIKHWWNKSGVMRGGPRGFQQSDDDAMNMPGNYMVPNAVMELLEPWRRPPGIF